MKNLIVLLFLTTAASLFSSSGVNNRLTQPAGYFFNEPLPEKTVYLTFDDGPCDWTADVLTALKKEKIKATFFICANWIPKSKPENNAFMTYKSSLIRMVKDGHSIGNHTANHYDLGKCSESLIRSQLEDNQKMLDAQLGSLSPRMYLMRPPRGSPWFARNATTLQIKVGHVISERSLVILWSGFVKPGDSANWAYGEWYLDNKRTDFSSLSFQDKAIAIHDRILSQADGRGMVLLLHDTHSTTVCVLSDIIVDLKSRGYRFDTIENLVKWKYGKTPKEMVEQTLY